MVMQIKLVIVIVVFDTFVIVDVVVAVSAAIHSSFSLRS